MAKQPYIPIYIGDWEQDTNTISLEAEGALLKLIFKLWKSDTKGVIEISLRFASILLKKSEEITLKILHELAENRVLNFDFSKQNLIKIESRRMIKEVELSKVRSVSGKKGGKQNKSKHKANIKQTPDIENEYDTDIDNSDKGAGERVEYFDIPPLQKKINEWIAYRKQIKKPLREMSKEKLPSELMKLANGNEEIAMQIIDKSIANGYQGLFPLKENQNAKSTKFQTMQSEHEKGIAAMEILKNKIA